MKTITIEEAAIMYHLQEPLFGLMRDITADPFDFGDEETIGCCVKSLDQTAPLQFGRFVGKMSGGYTIVCYDLQNRILGGQQFDTPEEMHKVWRVD